MARGIDHLVLAVRDLDAARDVYARLGFTCTPKAQHGWGTANMLMQLQGSFLEVLTVDRPELLVDPETGEFSFGRFNEAYLKARQGFSMLVLESRDRDGDLQDFKSLGLHTYAPFGFSRQAKQPNGEEVTVSFSLAFVGDENAPDIGFFTCQQLAPEYFWKREYQTHPNGAQKIAEIVMISANPGQHRSFLEGLSGAAKTVETEGGIKIETPRGILNVMTRQAVSEEWGDAIPATADQTPFLAAYVIDVLDLNVARQTLQSSGISYRDTGMSLIVSAADIFGVAIAFQQDL